MRNPRSLITCVRHCDDRDAKAVGSFSATAGILAANQRAAGCHCGMSLLELFDFPKIHISTHSIAVQWRLYNTKSYQFWVTSTIHPTGSMNTLENDIIRREQANQNNIDVEKGTVVGPDAGQSVCACSVSLVMPAIHSLAEQLPFVLLSQHDIC
jgi:hypothetical protein